MATKSQEILLKGNTTNASAVPSSLKVREIAINALDRSLFTNDGNSIVKLYTGTTKWFDVNGNANNALKLGGVLASEYINKEAFNSHINNSTIHITATERNAWNNKWDYNEDTIKGVKVNAAVLSDKATKLATARKIWGQSFDGNGNIDTTTYGMMRWLYFSNSSGVEQGYIGRGSDTNDIYLAVYGENSLHFITNSTRRATINPNGNILIGTTTDNGYKLDVNGRGHYSGDLICGGEVVAIAGEGTPAGVTDYSALTGKPSINGVTLLSGNNTLASLGIQAAGDYATNSGVTTLLSEYATKTFVSNNYAGKAAFNSHTADTDIHITAAERNAWNAKWDYNEATIKAVKVTSASSADSVAWSGIKDKPTNLSAFTNDVGYITGITKSMVEGVLTGDITSHTHTFASLTSKPTTIAGYGITDALTTSNYNSYAPTLTGTGASGTWGISISGNAASATKLQTPCTIWGQSFDGNMDVTAPAKMQYLLFATVGSNPIGYVGKGDSNTDTLFLGTYVESDVYLFSHYLSSSLILKPSGNVLIGTSTDNGYKLQVNGSERVYGDLIVDGEVSALVA